VPVTGPAESCGVSPRLIALLAALVTLLVGAPAHAATPSAVRVMTFNICGNVCRHGEVTGTAGNIAYQIRARHATVTMLQELCYSQFLGVRARLAKQGFTAVFAAASKGGRCDDFDHRHGRGFGVAIVARGRLTGRVVHALPSPSAIRAEGRVLLGSWLRIGGRSVYIVTTHTAPGGPNLARQMAAIQRYLSPIAANRPVIFGGDLNSLPDNADLDTFYSARYGGTGVFREADDTRIDPIPTFQTVPRKIDYLFASERFFTPRAAGAAGTRFSDHRMYVGVFG
jgi:endonuclease/exonuclease/phosphatase family metal-dependent hydrolase